MGKKKGPEGKKRMILLQCREQTKKPEARKKERPQREKGDRGGLPIPPLFSVKRTEFSVQQKFAPLRTWACLLRLLLSLL